MRVSLGQIIEEFTLNLTDFIDAASLGRAIVTRVEVKDGAPREKPTAQVRIQMWPAGGLGKSVKDWMSKEAVQNLLEGITVWLAKHGAEPDGVILRLDSTTFPESGDLADCIEENGSGPKFGIKWAKIDLGRVHDYAGTEQSLNDLIFDEPFSISMPEPLDNLSIWEAYHQREAEKARDARLSGGFSEGAETIV